MLVVTAVVQVRGVQFASAVCVPNGFCSDDAALTDLFTRTHCAEIYDVYTGDATHRELAAELQNLDCTITGCYSLASGVQVEFFHNQISI